MTRNLKALGLALVAVFAMSAMAASAAQAESTAYLTAGSAEKPVTIEGVQTTANVFGRSGRTVTCETANFAGGTVEGSVTELTVVPEYANCHSVVLGTKFPATVTMNSCDYQFTGTKVGSAYTVRSDLECSKDGDQVEIHVYSNAEHTSVLCTIDIPEQTNLDTITLTNSSGVTPDDVNADINVGGITSTETNPGLLCGPTETSSSTLTGGATLQAFEGATQRPLTVSG